MRKNLALLIIALLASLVCMNAAFAEKRGQVDICHYNEYGGYWELITVNGNSVNMHLANHDDAAPDGYTAQTSTYVDETCAEANVLPACGNCLTTDHGAGCEEQNCQGAIASIDPFCTSFIWDVFCVEEAELFCVDVYCTD